MCYILNGAICNFTSFPFGVRGMLENPIISEFLIIVHPFYFNRTVTFLLFAVVYVFTGTTFPFLCWGAEL